MITIWPQNRSISFCLARKRVFFWFKFHYFPSCQPSFCDLFFFLCHFFSLCLSILSSSDFWTLFHLRLRPLSWPGAWFLSWLPPRHGVRMTLSIRPWSLRSAHGNIFLVTGQNSQVQGIRYETQLEEDKIQFVIYSWYQGRRIEMIAQNGCAHLGITLEHVWSPRDARKFKIK